MIPDRKKERKKEAKNTPMVCYDKAKHGGTWAWGGPQAWAYCYP
jgi:hypothetical protein